MSSACALASAAAIVPMVSLERCMAVRLHIEEIEADGTRFRALGADAVADRLFGILGHQAFQFGLGLLVLEKGGPGRAEYAGELGPGIGRAHVDDPHCLNPWARRLNAEEA